MKAIILNAMAVQSNPLFCKWGQYKKKILLRFGAKLLKAGFRKMTLASLLHHIQMVTVQKWYTIQTFYSKFAWL